MRFLRNFLKYSCLALLFLTPGSDRAKAEKRCKIVPGLMFIIDEQGVQSTFTPDRPPQDVNNRPQFKQFVSDISRYLQDRLASTGNHCAPEVKFLYQPLIATTPSDTPAKAAPTGTIVPDDPSTACYLDSPWLKFSVSKNNKVASRAIFIWNERQFLIDQASLTSGIRAQSAQTTAIPEPLFLEYVQDYQQSVLSATSPEHRKTAKAAIAKRLPPEILWLFSHAMQSTRGPFFNSAEVHLRKTIEQASPGFTNMTKFLIDQCLKAEKPRLVYQNIVDLKENFQVEQNQTGGE